VNETKEKERKKEEKIDRRSSYTLHRHHVGRRIIGVPRRRCRHHKPPEIATTLPHSR